MVGNESDTSIIEVSLYVGVHYFECPQKEHKEHEGSFLSSLLILIEYIYIK